MSDNPKSNNGNYFNLPSLGVGDTLRPGHINALSREIAKAGAGIGSGGSLLSTPYGRVFSAYRSKNRTRPWQMDALNGYLFLTMGQFFWNKPNAGGVNQVTGGDGYFDNNVNGWYFMSTLQGVAPYGTDGNTAPYGFYMGGAEIWFEDAGWSVLNSRQLFLSGERIIIPIKQGLFYLQVAPWGGRQMQLLQGNDQETVNVNEGITKFNALSLQMAGQNVVQVRYAPFPDCFNVKGFVFPIATVDRNNFIYQGVSSDIVYPSSNIPPLTVSLVKQGTVDMITVTPGVVNNTCIPVIGSVALDVMPAPLLGFDGDCSVYLQVNAQARSFFPKSAEIVALPIDSPPTDTEESGYLLLANIRSQTVSGSTFNSVTQLITGNTIVNRYKMGTTGAYWSWSQ